MQPEKMEFLFALLMAAVLCGSVESCSSVTGPAGEYACVSIDRYSGKQYATCLTNTYIKLKSSGKHTCENIFASYCYYQCMLEMHDSNSGTVTRDCACSDSTGVTPTPISTGTTLPPYCYSPSGDSCTWYTECLERRVSCGPQTGYALAFGKKYCELYNQHYSKFSALTQQWVDAVRKCLQVSLVPLMRQFYNPTCDEIKTTAISHHTDCYMSPSVGKPSICDVSLKDVLTIFMTIKGAFLESDLTVFIGTWKSFFEVTGRCGFDLLTSAAKQLALFVYDFVVEPIKKGIAKRSVGSDPGDVAVLFATALSDSLRWKSLGIEWIPLNSNFTTTGAVRFQLLLGDQRQFDLNRNYSQSMNMTAEMQNLKTMVQNGRAYFSLGADGQSFYARQASECGNLNCTMLTSTVAAPAEPRSAAAPAALPAVVLLCTILATTVLVPPD